MSNKYKIIKSDLCIAGKIYKEGSIVNFMDESLKNFFEPIPEEQTISKEKITIADTPVAADQAETPSTPDLSKTSSNPELSETSSNPELSETSSNPELSETSSNPELSFRPEGEILTAPSPDIDINIPKKSRSKKVVEII